MSSTGSPNPLYALPALLQGEAALGSDDDSLELEFEPGPVPLVKTPEAEWTDARLRAHVELLRLPLVTGTDPVYVVPNAQMALELLAERGIVIDLALPRPLA